MTTTQKRPANATSVAVSDQKATEGVPGTPEAAVSVQSDSVTTKPPTHCEACGSWLFEDLAGRSYCLTKGCERHRQTAGQIDGASGELAAALEGAGT